MGWVRDPESLWRRIAAFVIAPLLSLIAPLVVLPVIADSTDASGWASLAVGQSVGAVAGILVAFGWPLVGPVEVARSERAAVGVVLFESLLSRGVLLAGTAIPAAAIAALAAPTGRVTLTVITALATMTFGLTFNWVAIGLGRARSIIAFDAVPRVAFALLTAVIVVRGGSLFWYPALTAAASIAGLLLFCIFVVRPNRPDRPLGTALRARLGGQAPAAATALAGGAYSAGALFLVGISTSVHETALMSSADRLYQLGLLAIVALGNALQAWVVPPDHALVRGRRRRALHLHTMCGVVGLVGFAAVAPTASRVLFGADLTPGYDVALAYGLALAFLAPATSLAQHVLVPDGRVREIMQTTLLGAAVGVPALLILSRQFGAAGGAAGLALSELVVLVRLAWLVRSARSRPMANFV
jgi:O-antigen/teichoic acid export membrane protein